MGQSFSQPSAGDVGPFYNGANGSFIVLTNGGYELSRGYRSPCY